MAWPGTCGAAATPVRRNASHSQVARYQRVRAAMSGSWRSSHSAAGSGPSAQPRMPVAAASSSASAVARVSRNVMAGWVASPSSSTAASVGP